MYWSKVLPLANRSGVTTLLAISSSWARVLCSSRERRLYMLELRPGCECCDRDLPPDSEDARIGSFQCTFCRACAEALLHGRGPNCGGELLPRPRRPLDKLAQVPASTARGHQPAGCPS